MGDETSKASGKGDRIWQSVGCIRVLLKGGDRGVLWQTCIVAQPFHQGAKEGVKGQGDPGQRTSWCGNRSSFRPALFV